MGTDTTQLLKLALGLPDKERADLAAQTIDSLDPHVDAAAEAAWDAEVARRIAELDAGSVQPIPWPAVRRTLRRALDGNSEHSVPSQSD